MTDLAPLDPQNARERELVARATRDYAALQAVGLDTTRTFFAPGTEATIAKTTGRIAAKRREFERLPDAQHGLIGLSDAVLAEDRRDMTVKFGGFPTDAPDEQHLSLSLYGGWYTGKSGKLGDALAPTDRSYAQLISKRPAGHAAPGPDVASWMCDAKQHDVVLRTRKLPMVRSATYSQATRECYAIVSPDYKPYDLNEAALDLAKVAPSGSRTRIRYDGARATVDVVLQNPYRLDGEDVAAVGETHQVVLRMRTADDGSGGYHLSLLAQRVRCINLTLLHSKRSLMHGTHLQSNLRELAEQALEAIEPTMEAFAATWRAAWGEYYADKYTKASISGEEALKRIVAWGKFRVAGLGAEGTLKACLAALANEPGDSRAHVHNAMTAAAHHAPVSWATRWSDEDAEEQASQLLYQKLAWLPEAEA